MTANSGHRSYDNFSSEGLAQTREPAQRITVISPHSEEPIGDVEPTEPEDVDTAVAAARHAFDHGPWPRHGRQGTDGQGR